MVGMEWFRDRTPFRCHAAGELPNRKLVYLPLLLLIVILPAPSNA